MTESNPSQAIKLLYPYYLDPDMSMAFAAALTGGVAFEEQQHDRSDETSKAVKNLRGNLKVLSALGFGGGVEAGRSDVAERATTSELQVTRHHTFASIFIDLYDELRASSLLLENPAFEDMSLGDLVSIQMGPATAPLRRVVDQVIRLLEVTMPMVTAQESGESPTKTSSKRHQRQGAPPQARPDEGVAALGQLYSVLVALRDDLARSGLVDVLVGSADRTEARAVLTLDRRFLSDTALELVHTSSFTVVGKVTQLWPTEDDVLNLYRRSVVSLAPSLTQATMWALFTLVGLITKAIDPDEVQRSAAEALRVAPEASADPPPTVAGVTDGITEDATPETAAPEDTDDEVKFSKRDDRGRHAVRTGSCISDPAARHLRLASIARLTRIPAARGEACSAPRPQPATPPARSHQRVYPGLVPPSDAGSALRRSARQAR